MYHTRFLEYITSNELLKYPFTDNASLTNGAYSIPTNLFIDAVIYGKTTKSYFIKNIFQDGYNLNFDIYQEPDISIFTVSVAQDVANIRKVIAVNTAISGNIYIGRFLFGDGLTTVPFPSGTEVFTLNQTEFLPSVAVPSPMTVYSMGISDEEATTPPLFDDVKLRQGCNIIINHDTLEISTGKNDEEACACEKEINSDK